jgi:hypothetical protein
MKATRVRDNDQCQVCGRQWKPEDGKEKITVDHIVAYRLCLSNELINLLSVCRAPCHVKKSAAENCLLRGDVLGFQNALRILRWPMEKVEAALHWWNSSPQLGMIFRGPTVKLTCRRGHPWVPENIGVYKWTNGRMVRWCKVCRRERERRKRPSRRNLIGNFWELPLEG